MEGGPSQLDTFDPHPGTQIGGDTKSISTSARGIEVAVGLDQVAEQMQHIALVRNVVSREGDHERAAYNFRTGYRPDPTLVHPSIGAIICHKLPIGQAEIPRHVSILPRAWYGRGGYLGGEYDAFKSYDPSGQLPDVKARVDEVRFSQRLAYLNVTDETFANDRLVNIEQQRTLHRTTIDRAVMMMSSEQLKAFDVSEEPAAVQEEFGDTPFGRGCLAALRLVEHGVRCIEVGLGGWDGHFNNYDIQNNLKQTLDSAFAALVRNLHQRGRLDQTLVLCGGEFGRTPRINPAAGRDHWAKGFSVALAGGGLCGGLVVGQTDSGGQPVPWEKGTTIADLHATMLTALGIHPAVELDTPVGRPIKLREGRAIPALVGNS